MYWISDKHIIVLKKVYFFDQTSMTPRFRYVDFCRIILPAVILPSFDLSLHLSQADSNAVLVWQNVELLVLLMSPS